MPSKINNRKSYKNIYFWLSSNTKITEIYFTLLWRRVILSNKTYYNIYFETNWYNIKKTWKGIKSLNSLKTIAFIEPIVTSLDNGETITNPHIANTFNNYFASIIFTRHLLFLSFSNLYECGQIPLKTTNKEEIANITSFLKSNKASVSHSIPYRIFFFL